MTDVFRVYLDPAEIGPDGYPHAWHKVVLRDGSVDSVVAEMTYPIKDLVREQAGHRCVRCGHPYRKGEHGNGEWSTCDAECRHPVTPSAPVRWRTDGREWRLSDAHGYDVITDGYGLAEHYVIDIEAQWRILTVHHLNGIKHDCRWWNLVALCQRCHLTIQAKVHMERRWDRPHTEWFRPYVAGYYAATILGEELSREQVMARLDELLALELRQDALF